MYNKCSKLTFTQKIEEPLSTRVSVCLEASMIKVNIVTPITEKLKQT